MSQDESLRLAATVVDGFTGPLKNLRTQMQGLAREGAGHTETLEKSFGKVTGAMRQAETAAASGLNPALKTVGITSLTATAAILGVGAAMRSFVSSSASLGQMSRDTGIAAQTLRDFGAVAGKFNVTQEQVAQGAQTFADKMRVFSRGQGDLFAWLNAQGRDPAGRKHFQDFAADLVRTKDTSDQLRKALQEMENIKDPRERRIFAEQFFGNADIARLADGTLGRLKEVWDKTASKLGPLDPKAVESAERFERSMADLGSSMRKLGTTLGQEVLPYAERFVTWIDDVVSDQRGGAIAAIRENLSGVKRELDQINWTQFGNDSLAVLKETTALAGTLATSLHRIAEALRAFREDKKIEAFRHLDGASGPLARRLAPLPGDDKIERDEQADVLRGKIGTTQEQGALQAELLKDLQERGDKEGVKRLTDAMEANAKQLKALQDALGKLTTQGGASVQQQSFDGSGFGGGLGGLIQKAAFGGGGGGGGYGGGGTLGERLFGRPTGANAAGDPYRQQRMDALRNDPSAEWRMRIGRGETGVPLPGGGGDRGFRGRPFGSPSPDSGAGRAGRALRGGDSEPPATDGYSGNDGRRASRSGMTAAGRANVASWMDFFRKPTDQGGMGYTEEQARGQIAMMQGESGLNLNPAAMGDHDRAGVPHAFGTVQWSDAKGNQRFPRLRALAAEMGKDWRDRGVQQEMYRREMMGAYGGVYKRIRNAQTGEQSLWTGIVGYENPREHSLAYSIRQPFLNRLRRDAANPSGATAADAGGSFPNGAPRILKPKSMGGDSSVPGVVLDADGLRQIKPWSRADKADGSGFAAAFKRRQQDEEARREGLRLSDGAQGALRAGANGGAKVEVNGSMTTVIRTRDPGTQVSHSASGNLFREIVQSRGRQMSAARDDG